MKKYTTIILFFITISAFSQSSVCDCWQTRDATFSVVPFDGSGGSGGPGSPPDYRNDDWSTNPINLPFNFCFYGLNITTVYINNNGNISFGSAESTFNSNPFPDATYSMVAPFWGDVDTRSPQSQLVYYKLTPTALIVQWDSVGYFDQNADKRNTFQLIITNGTDPLVPNGNNVSFCYKDMQWTTGDASSGVNGFGGTPATVGANRGDGVNYIQFGRFDQAGPFYDGAFGNADGIDWLDNQNFVFNTCNSSNIAPVVTDFSICEADTVSVCENEVLTLSVSFQSPESNQVTTASVSAPGVNGFSVLSSTSGNTAVIVTQMVGGQNNLGYSTVTFTGTDNGNPVQSTSFDLVIFVDTAPSVSVTPVNSNICTSTQVPLNAAGAISYAWNPATGLSTSTGASVIATPMVTTTYAVIGIAANGCKDTAFTTINIGTLQVDINPPNPIICDDDSVLLTAFGGVAHTWSPSGGLSSINNDSVYANPNITTTYYVNADSSGCVGTDTVTVIVNSIPPLLFFPPTPAICNGDSIEIIVSGANTYSWSPSSGLDNTTNDTVNAWPDTSTVYYVSGNLMGCIGYDSVEVVVNALPNVSILPPDPVICFMDSMQLKANGADSYEWFPLQNISGSVGDSVIVFPSDTFTYYVAGTDANTCRDTDSVKVVVNFNFLADAGNDIGFCRGDSGIIGSAALQGCTYHWNPGGGLVNVDSSETGVKLDNNSNDILSRPYILTVVKNNCPDSDTVVVRVYPDPVAICSVNPGEAGAGTIISLTSNSMNAGQCMWETGNGDSIAGCSVKYIYGAEGKYEITLKVTSDYGCFSDTTCYVEITEFSVYIPNTFTPDDDGRNDEFKVYGRNIFSFRIMIFDRWGHTVFQSEDINQGWDGKIKNQWAKQDVYVYKLEFMDIDANEYKRMGRVTLIR